MPDEGLGYILIKFGDTSTCAIPFTVGGHDGANSAHPLENPNYFTDLIELLSQSVLPFALVFALGYYLRRKKLALMIFGVMTVGFLMLVIPTVISEVKGNPLISRSTVCPQMR